ncbi:ras-related protein Rab-33B-like [Aethina tumida]|uniref:ras-related protein Rab-33B-like n=1 Tax=Aethina tumida TaxID=116153 RepID=UPI00096B43DE|nr:ras-related protein Rab-33B-like [Aethina tumida]
MNSEVISKSNATPDRIFKVIVIGDSNVGKTSLTYRFCEGKFLPFAEATIGVDFRTRIIDVDGEKILLQLWDTAGQERHRMSMVRHYYRNTHAIVFVYDVTNRNSFLSLKKWIEESTLNCLADVPCILIGNKCDENQVISTQEAQKFADENNMPLFETSARLDDERNNVDAIFLTLAHKLKNHKKFIQDNPQKTTIKATHVDDCTKSGWYCC